MSEINIGTSQFVYLDLYGGTADTLPTATVTNDLGVSRSLVVIQDTLVGTMTDRYRATLNMADTQREGELQVDWSLTVDTVPVTKTDYFEVITPYLTYGEVKEIWPNATDAEIAEVEAAVRFVINAHTGQTFGFASNKTIVVEGHGDNSLRLPSRLVTLTGWSTLTANLDPNAVIIVSDGWYLKKAWADELSQITSTSTYWTGWDSVNSAAPGEPGYEKPSHGPVISAPGTSGISTPWRAGYPFTIVGDWGYKTVPNVVRAAARLLVNDYACQEIAYRDRYLESVKAADWRLQFSSRAWEYTGNVRADQLLSEFVLLDWAVI